MVELDGYEHHRTRAAFERDRERAAALERAGYRVLRFSWRQVVGEPWLVAETVLAAAEAANAARRRARPRELPLRATP